jgi:hypothetical protein
VFIGDSAIGGFDGLNGGIGGNYILLIWWAYEKWESKYH